MAGLAGLLPDAGVDGPGQFNPPPGVLASEPRPCRRGPRPKVDGEPQVIRRLAERVGGATRTRHSFLRGSGGLRARELARADGSWVLRAASSRNTARRVTDPSAALAGRADPGRTGWPKKRRSGSSSEHFRAASVRACADRIRHANTLADSIDAPGASDVRSARWSGPSETTVGGRP